MIPFPDKGLNFFNTITELELYLIEQALIRSKGNRYKAAELLTLNKSTLVQKMKKLDLFKNDYSGGQIHAHDSKD